MHPAPRLGDDHPAETAQPTDDALVDSVPPPEGLPTLLDSPRPQSPTASAAPRLVSRILGAAAVAILLTAVGGFIGLYFQPPGLAALFRAAGLEPGGGSRNPIAVAAPGPNAAESADAATGDIVALGRLVPRGNTVVIAPPFGAGDARIETLNVSAGQKVDANQVVAVLDSLAEREAAVEIATAAVAVREATLSQTQSSVRSSRKQTQAALDRAKTVAKQAQADLTRTQRLHRDGIATLSELEQAQSQAEQAASSVTEGNATLSRYASGRRGSQADVLVATKNLASARAERDHAEQEVEKSKVRAPSSGVVLSVRARPGERPGSGGIITLGDIDEMIAEVEVYQDLVGRVEVGDRVSLVADALPATLHGTVERIGLVVERQSILDADPAANTDARVVQTDVALDAESSRIARSFTNLEVVARIDTTRDPS